MSQPSSEFDPVEILRAARASIEATRDQQLSESSLLRVLADAVIEGAHVKNRFHYAHRQGYQHEHIIAAVDRAKKILQERGSLELPAASVELARALEKLVPHPGLATAVRELIASNTPNASVISELQDRIEDWLDDTIERVHFDDMIDESQ